MDDDFAGYPLSARKVPWVRLILALVTIGLVVGALLPAVQTRHVNHRHIRCASNLRQVGLGLQGYHNRYGCFPPAYIADASGKPMHSWRTLILPFIDNQDLYDAYEFDEPWDGPNNRKLADESIGIYRCPSGNHPTPGLTDFFLIRGPGTAFPGGGKGVSRADVRDDPTSTILVVEVADAGIHWSEPRDLDFDRMSFRINDPSGSGISSRHVGANILMMDGSCKRLGDQTRPEIVRAMITISGREPLPITHPPR